MRAKVTIDISLDLHQLRTNTGVPVTTQDAEVWLEEDMGRALAQLADDDMYQEALLVRHVRATRTRSSVPPKQRRRRPEERMMPGNAA
ncbi:MAG: hypothetical protein ACOC9B_04990 [Chloroflexota bacterium]